MSFIYNSDGSMGVRIGGKSLYTDPKAAALLSHPGLAFERQRDTCYGLSTTGGGGGASHAPNDLESSEFTCYGFG